MVLTNFPQGATSFGTPLVGGSLPIIPNGGTYWFVDSVNGGASNPGTYDAPFATWQAAVTAAVANDVIILNAGHAETITTAGAVTLSKGTQTFGMGSGSRRPTITVGTATTTTASVLITGAGTRVDNVVFIAGTASGTPLTNPIHVQAAGVVLNIEWQDASATVEAARAILTTAAADNLRVSLKYVGFPAGSGCVNAIRLVGCNDAIINCDFYGKASTAWIEFLTTACTDVEVYGYMYNSGTTNGSKNVIDTQGSSTWYANINDGTAGATSAGGSGSALSFGSAAAAGVALKAAAVMVNGDTLFTVTGGPIKIEALVSICVTANDGTASTLQYSATPTSGSATTISAASASLASAAAGATVTLAGTALATAALLSATGPNLIANPGTVVVPAGTIKAVIGVGSTTGTWRHYLRYSPLAAGVTVA